MSKQPETPSNNSYAATVPASLDEIDELMRQYRPAARPPAATAAVASAPVAAEALAPVPAFARVVLTSPAPVLASTNPVHAPTNRVLAGTTVLASPASVLASNNPALASNNRVLASTTVLAATTPVLAPSNPAPAAASAVTSSAVLPPAAADNLTLKIVARGFNAIERSLLEGTVKVSQRRTPRLQLLGEHELDSADVVMIDTRDAPAMEWARRHPTLQRKAVIWVDGDTAPRGHTLARRPVQWPILPMLLARALEQAPTARPAPAATPSHNAPSHDAPATVAARPATMPQSAGPAPAGQAHTAMSTSAAAAPAATAPRALPVLVVDDSLAVRAYLRSLLESRGYEVKDVDCAQAAIDAVSSARFACLLMDVLMPGIDGYEGCKQIKAKLRGTPGVPIIMLTSKSSPFDRIRGKMAGCDAYLAKPVDPVKLYEVLAQHGARPGTNAGAAQPAVPAKREAVALPAGEPLARPLAPAAAPLLRAAPAWAPSAARPVSPDPRAFAPLPARRVFTP